MNSVSWLPNQEETLEGYEVYQSASSLGPWVLEATVLAPTSSYTDVDGVLGSWYRVRAYDIYSSYSDYSTPVEASEPKTVRVYGNIRDLGFDEYDGAEISVVTNPRKLFCTETNVIIPDSISTTSDENGWWSLFLTSNILLSPSGSSYVFEFVGIGQSYERRVVVEDLVEVSFVDLEEV